MYGFLYNLKKNRRLSAEWNSLSVIIDFAKKIWFLQTQYFQVKTIFQPIFIACKRKRSQVFF